MGLLDTTIVNIAIPTLGRDFHAQLSTIQWTATAYLLALSIVIPLSGWAVERWGAKRVWLVSIMLFTAGSALCAASWSVPSLVVFRCLQGAGGGMILPVGQTIIAQAAGPLRMGRMMSAIGAPTLLAPILGPVLGGMILEYASWRLIFLVNVPVGVVAVLAGLRVFRSEPRVAPAKKLDVLGFATLALGLACLVFGLSRVAVSSITTLASGGVIVAGVCCIVVFIAHALRQGPAALIDMALFKKSRSFVAAAVMSLLFSAQLLGVMLLLPIYYQSVRGQGPLAAGALIAPQGLGAICGMFTAGWLTDRIGAGRVVPVGVALGVLGTCVLTQVGAAPSLGLLAAALFVRGLGLGSMMTPAIAAALATLRRADVPGATTALNIIQRISGAFGTALLAVILTAGIPSADRAHLFSSGAAVSTNALAQAFQDPFWVAVAMLAALIIPALMLPRRVLGLSSSSELEVVA